MFIPLYDVNARKHLMRPYVNWALIALNVAVSVIVLGGGELVGAVYEGAVLGLGYIPAVVNETRTLPPGILDLPDALTYVTYMFVHANWWHLGSNLLFLWVFGDNVEDAMGHARYLLFVLACGAAGALLHGLIDPGSEAPLIGASGGVAGVIAAYLMLHPRVRVWVLILFRIPLPLPAMWVLGFWAASQFVNVVIGDANVAWWAHIGGLLAGAALVVVLRRPGVPLFDRGLPSAQ